MSLPKARKWLLPAGLALVAVFLAVLVFLVWRWPFRREAVLKDLREASESRVDAVAFHSTYFPRPGCVLEQVTFQHDPNADSPPLIVIQKLQIEGSFFGLFTRHLKRIRAGGMRIVIPRRGSGEQFTTPKRSSFVIDDLIADGALLEVLRDQGEQPLKFSFHNFTLSNIGSRGPASFQARLSNPEPPGEITTAGKFGPWNADHVGQTVVSGEYWFEQADLGVFGGIAGLLSSSGKFSGMLDRIEVQGSTDIPHFTVTSSSHQVQLRTQFHAVVNGENGDLLLQKVSATFLKTAVWADGSVAGAGEQPGKTASIEIAARDARIQDVLLLFARSQRAPMSGILNFHAKLAIPPAGKSFLQKVELQGDFGIDAGAFTKSDTQQGVNRLSHGAVSDENPHKNDRDDKDRDRNKNKDDKNKDTDADKDDPETVLSDLKGHVLLKNGTARFSNLSFSVPGALARMQGTYNLISEKIDLHGTLKTDSRPSNSTEGIKSAMLKVLNPFFKKKSADYEMPVKITGTYRHPLFGLDLTGREDKQAREAKAHASRLLKEKGKP